MGERRSMENITAFDDTGNAVCKKFYLTKTDLLEARTGTDGFQPKFFTKDRKYFIKMQAALSGVLMQDWRVEIIASDFCRQLGIPCVLQKECIITYAGRDFYGVYSENFENAGYTFCSFESLLNRQHLSLKDDAFIRLKTADKIRWCASELAELSGICFKKCMKYMLDLAVIDCLVGNVDRHGRNFGLFFHSDSSFSIPLIFDSGMGLFEHDYYRDHYNSYEDAMMTVYVSPYGEDPFDLVKILRCEFNLSEYDFKKLKMPEKLPNKNSAQYLQDMFRCLQEV